MIKKSLIAAAMMAGVMSAPAMSQQSGLVNVDIGDVSVLNNFLNDTQIAALNNLNVPITVQAPIGVAANVCGTTVAVLAQAGSAARCDAQAGSQALAQLVNRQLLNQRR